MKFIADLHDHEYPKQGFSMIRNTARALLFNDKGELAMLAIEGNDAFGKRHHFETPGGGIEMDEKGHNAVVREVIEEVGYECVVDADLGLTINRYNLLGVITVSHYYVCHLTAKRKMNRTEGEEILINGIVWKTPEAWLTILNEGENPVDRLVHQREHAALSAYLNQDSK